MSSIIKVNNLYHEYTIKNNGKKEKKVALKGINFEVKQGEVFGLLGPNGAGKTTTIKILTTLLIPKNGNVTLLDKDILKSPGYIRKNINFMLGGERGIYNRLTPIEYLKYFSLLYKIKIPDNKLMELLELVGLEKNANEETIGFSKGMKQRLHIARVLINNPKIVFLDEPTIGLDPVISEEVRLIISRLSKKNITVILTTHYMQEADDLCDRIAIIDEGEIKIIGTPTFIKSTHSDVKFYEVTCSNLDEVGIFSVEEIRNLAIKTIEGGLKLIRFEYPVTSTIKEVQKEINQFCSIIKINIRDVTLEDAYIKLVR
ncbi:ABC transporter ATP-binding protein [Cytobacillus kochii]|uniref:ABC transporter ATP-binding protein n=1 Tax=Cytobacillus kochii TaxID=859143 RepID=UPI001CD52491|nr:ABC transporter ATP-binding protein [Cytobacillus kochii]MCA1028644.1 ABC transporter ATP-binding protein [Cytobacillus kochii]